MKITLTGVAGFVGFHLAKELLSRGHEIQGFDLVTEYYSVELKRKRIQELRMQHNAANFHFIECGTTEPKFMSDVISFHPEVIIHLAAQAGVRQSLQGIKSYSRDNIEGFLRVLEVVKIIEPRNFLYASSSSVYGDKSSIPFKESEIGLQPSSIYGVTKLANELFIPTILSDTRTKVRGLRFFTVYGPFGRPDMAYFRAIGSAICNQDFKLFGTGEVRRDFTFIHDVIDSIILLEEELVYEKENHIDIVNVGGGNPVSIQEMIVIIERELNKTLRIKRYEPVREDIPVTFCDPLLLKKLTGKKNFTSLEVGLKETVEWFKTQNEKDINDWLRI